MRIEPFAAWRPAVAAERVACPPYDTLETEEARALAAGNPDSFLHVTKAEIDLPPGHHPYDEAVYARAAAAWRRLRREGIMRREADPALYVYRQSMGAHVQHGVAACCLVDDYRNGTLRRHEHTREDKLNDRVRLMEALQAQSGPVFVVYPDASGVASEVARVMKGAPLYDLATDHGARHTLWRVEDTQALVDAFVAVPTATIADGHHRAAAAAAVCEARRHAGGPEAVGDAARFLTVMVPAGDVRIMGYHRVVQDLNGMTPAGFLARLADAGVVTPVAAPVSAAGHVGVFLDGGWYDLALLPPTADGAAALDVSRLQDLVLEPLLGIRDPRRDPRLRFVGGIKGAAEPERQVRSGDGAAAFILHPPSIGDLMRIADTGGMMPPKSTWFEPKLLSGLLVHAFDHRHRGQPFRIHFTCDE